jgi:hypothetical protein
MEKAEVVVEVGGRGGRCDAVAGSPPLRQAEEWHRRWRHPRVELGFSVAGVGFIVGGLEEVGGGRGIVVRRGGERCWRDGTAMS